MWNLQDQSRIRERTNRHKKAKRCSEDGWSPLHVAALRGDVSTIHSILKQEPDMIKCVTSKTNSTALHFAAISGNVNAVQSVLAHCFSDEAGMLLSRSHPVTPDHQGGWLFPMEKDLAESFGAMELRRNSQQGYLALDLAIISADEEIVDVLLAAHRSLVLSSPSASSSSGGGDSEISPRHQKEQGSIHISIHYVEPDILIYTTRRQDLAMLSKLLQHGASIESWCDPETLMRPLHWAAEMGSLPVASLLLQNGADPLSRTREGLTASDLVQSLHPENEPLMALLDQCSEI